MTSPTDAHLERLIRALAGLPDDRARQLVDEAWERAEAAVRDTLITGMQAALLRQVTAVLEEEGSATAPRPAPGRTAAVDTGSPGRPAGDVASNAPPEAAVERPGAPEGETAVRATPDVGTAEARASEARGAEAGSGLVWYVYAVTLPSSDTPPVAVRPMADGHGPQIVTAAGLSAVVSEVPAAAFGPRALQDRLADREWLEEHVRRHDEALRVLAGHVALVPMRFCTVVRSTEDVERFLADHGRTLHEALETVAGRREWGVKVRAAHDRLHDRVRSENAEIQALDERIAQQSGGTAYFLEKRRAQLLEDEAERLTLDVVGRWHARLHGLAAGSELLPLQRHADGQKPADHRLVLNGAYLVAEDTEAAFRQAVDTLAAQGEALGLAVELTGPWPPYSFVHLDLATDLAR